MANKMPVHRIGIAQFRISLLVELNFDYVLARNAVLEQTGLKEPEKEKALSAAAETSHDLHKTVASGLHQPIKV